jgi:FkbM family methyltransferase
MPVVNVTVNLPTGEHQMRFNLDPRRPTEGIMVAFLKGGRLYEPEIAEVFNRAILPGDTVLDVGANIGIFSILAARLVGPKGCVVGFEPAADNLERLAANLALNDLTNVVVVDQPASDRVGSVTFYLNSDNDGGHSLWDPGKDPLHPKSRENLRPIVTTTTTIDTEVARLGLAPPRLIKIDAEGAEHLVLAGAVELLREYEIPYIIAELNEIALSQMGSSQAALRGFMADLGYDTFLLYQDGSLPKLVPRDTRIESHWVINMLFSTPVDVAALWPLERHDPRSTAPVAPARMEANNDAHPAASGQITCK